MNTFYLLNRPVAPPSPPLRWSFSELTEWRVCPRRWWLLRAKYPQVSGRYPTRISAEALEGIVVHQLVEDFGTVASGSDNGFESLNEALAVFGPRVKAREALTRLLAHETLANPRIDPEQLKVRVSYDRCLNQFKHLISLRPPALQRSWTLHAESEDQTAFLSGHEKQVKIDDPPVVGRLDLVAGGRIIDFKTGQPSVSHEEQIRFYALLYYLATGSLPRGLTLYYSGGQGEVIVDVPGVEALKEALQGLRDEIAHTHKQLGSNNPPDARPTADTCRFCPVRQHCDPFWSAVDTQCLRAEYLSEVSEEERVGAFFLDVALDSLPEGWTGAGPCAGWAVSPRLGQVQVTIDREKSPPLSSPRPVGALILGARMSYDGSHWHVFAGRGTEVFWMPADYTGGSVLG